MFLTVRCSIKLACVQDPFGAHRACHSIGDRVRRPACGFCCCLNYVDSLTQFQQQSAFPCIWKPTQWLLFLLLLLQLQLLLLLRRLLVMH